MLGSHNINIFDRIKETSYTTGVANFSLNGAPNGFSTFGSSYANNANIFYAATDGTYYEVGSGVYVTGVQNEIVRFPFKSTNSNNKVNFGEGLKEIFVTYPATHSVYTASGLNNSVTPQSSGLAFWLSSNIVGYDSKLIWDSTNTRLGINKSNPTFAIDVGGNALQSLIRSSGIVAGPSGITFPSGNNGDSGYAGGVQLTHYEKNTLNSLSGSDSVLELSGVANNHILLKKQDAGLVFAGPASGCTPPCSPDYPTFRPLLVEDIHDFNASVINNDSGISIYQSIGVNTALLHGNITSYTNSFDPTVGSGWVKSAYLASGLYGGGLSLVNTFYANPVLQSGYAIYTADSGVTLNFNMGNPSGITSGVLSLNANNPSGITAATMDFYGQKIRIRNSKTPQSATDIGNSGDLCWDSSYIYVCIAPNVWKRAALSTWP